MMGLDIGIIKITYLDRPTGFAYRFAWELAIEASVCGYMHGEGNNWAPFTQMQVLLLLENFAAQNRLDDAAKSEVLEWVRSLPWDGWIDDLDVPLGDQDDDDLDVSNAPNDEVGGLIELHFNW
jgi:hypothetical protein